MSVSNATSFSMTAKPSFPQGESNPHASIQEASLASYAAAEIRPASGPSVTLTETDPVIVVRSARGGWINVPMSPEQKTKLIGLHAKLNKNLTDDLKFNLHRAYSEINGIRNFDHSTDSQIIRDLRALVAEIVQRKDMPWEEFPMNFRAPLNVASNMTRNAPCAKTLEERFDAFKSGLEPTESAKVDLAEKVFSDYEAILNGLPERIKDLEPKDKKGREEAILNAQKSFEQMHKEAVLFTVGTKDGVSWDERWKMATAPDGFLQIDKEKDHQYLEDVVRLKCKTREAYMRESTEIETKHKYYAPLPVQTRLERFGSVFYAAERKHSRWEFFKSVFTGETFQEYSKTASVLESRRERAETFFVQLVEAQHANDRKAVETLLNGPLFEMAFEELHDEERKVVQKKLIAKYCPASAVTTTGPAPTIVNMGDGASAGAGSTSAYDAAAAVQAEDAKPVLTNAVSAEAEAQARLQ